MKKIFFDFHVHPTIKPFGHACKQVLKKKLPITKDTFSYEYLKEHQPKILDQLLNPRKKCSMWREDNPSRLLNPHFAELAFAKYSQSNFTAAEESGSRVLCVSLYPIEKEFLLATCDQKVTGLPLAKNLVTGVTSARIKYIQSDRYKYFANVEAEYEYLKTSSQEPSSKGQKFHIAGSYAEVDAILKKEPNAIVIIITIEGANVLYPTKEIRKEDIGAVLANIQAMKNWEHPPFFITLAHHFYNGFVSHEKSLVSLVTTLGKMNQKPHMNQPVSAIHDLEYFTEEGLQVIDAMLDDTNGKRILIDVKHIDYRGRKQYYALLEEKYNNQVPVIVSHGAIGAKVEGDIFNDWTLNLNDDDIAAVWKTNGLIGIELDQRVLGFDKLLKYKKRKKEHPKRLSPEFNSELVWNAMHYIAGKCADIIEEKGLQGADPWSVLTIGSDYDGLINPINKYPTLVSYPLLKEHLVKHARKFKASGDSVLHKHTRQTPEELVDQIMHENGLNFLKKNF
ncbi:hypothetical protein DMA11_16160 [Marinilabiliaceae bacterium JC017]|nr:hypothetical protein DMA11_16160 [Marinilabiliaceae bacterium JC017]